MGICYYCEQNISFMDICGQNRMEIQINGTFVGDAHTDCYTLAKKYGMDYFIIKKYLVITENSVKRRMDEYDFKAHIGETGRYESGFKTLGKIVGIGLSQGEGILQIPGNNRKGIKI